LRQDTLRNIVTDEDENRELTECTEEGNSEAEVLEADTYRNDEANQEMMKHIKK
jgi:hypothetical protein